MGFGTLIIRTGRMYRILVCFLGDSAIAATDLPAAIQFDMVGVKLLP